MEKRIFLLLAFGLFLLGGSKISAAAEITCLHKPGLRCSIALLKGKITHGDFQPIYRFLAINNPELGTVYLNSGGGDVDEALKIGRLFRKYLIETTAPTRFEDGSSYFPLPGEPCNGFNCGLCASACALIWFGGVDRGGSVGLHRPRTDDPSFRQLSAADASQRYRQWQQAIFRYLVEMEVPRSVIELTESIGSDEITWVDDIDDRLDYPPSIAEWVKASCPQESGAEIVRRLGQFPQNLHSIARQRATCEETLLYNSRVSLLPPPPLWEDLPE
jgi:hypothetical protein